MTALPPGPGLRELDARLAELLGRTIWPEHRDFRSYDGGPAMVVDGPNPHDYPRNERYCRYGPVPRYSTDVSAAISAAEEARNAGRIKYWTVSGGDGSTKPVDMLFEGCVYTQPGGYGGHCEYGDTPAHALSLALRAALER